MYQPHHTAVPSRTLDPCVDGGYTVAARPPPRTLRFIPYIKPLRLILALYSQFNNTHRGVPAKCGGCTYG